MKMIFACYVVLVQGIAYLLELEYGVDETTKIEENEGDDLDCVFHADLSIFSFGTVHPG